MRRKHQSFQTKTESQAEFSMRQKKGSMDRLMDRTHTFRHRASEYICKMLFSRSPAPALVPRGNPWFAWLTTLAILWSFRRPIARTVMSLAPLNTIRNRLKQTSEIQSSGYISCSDQLSQSSKAMQVTRIPKYRPVIYKKHNNAGIKTRVKRLCSGDGPPVRSNSSSTIASHQISYKVTRSGKVYGKYQNEV